MWSLTIEAHDSRQYLALNNQHLSYWKLWMPLWRFMGIIFVYIQADYPVPSSSWMNRGPSILSTTLTISAMAASFAWSQAMHFMSLPFTGRILAQKGGQLWENVWTCMSWAAKMSETQCHQRLNLPFNILKLNELIVSAMQVALSYDVDVSTTRVIHVAWGNVIVNNAAMLANSRTSRWRGVLQFLGAERDATTYEEASSSCERGQILCGW